VPIEIDPCRLVTQQEASALTGATFGPGREESEAAGEKRCVYGYQTMNVFIVAVVQAATVAEAQSAKDQIRAEAKQQLGAAVSLSRVAGLGDDAESLQGSGSLGGGTLSLGGIYVLRGRTGFALIDATAGHAPGTGALTAQARTVLGRLP
jgi:hypothetical protein